MEEKLKVFSMPTIEYLKFGNIFSGSLKNFNYKLFPKAEENKVRVVVFKGRFSFENCENFKEKTFEFKENLIREITIWFEEEFKNLK